ncbi:hypothetical protein [Streptomyces sp. NPDC056987]|uniref:hypothetical protein n=1 Tax=Streptomyces sp. NPDC056987 TaxID=3345988 RepID=UPI003642289C
MRIFQRAIATLLLAVAAGVAAVSAAAADEVVRPAPAVSTPEATPQGDVGWG